MLTLSKLLRFFLDLSKANLLFVGLKKYLFWLEKNGLMPSRAAISSEEKNQGKRK